MLEETGKSVYLIVKATCSLIFLHFSGWRTMLVVPELEKEVELLCELRDMREVNGSSHSISY